MWETIVRLDGWCEGEFLHYLVKGKVQKVDVH